jgi:hypothetical protein
MLPAQKSFMQEPLADSIYVIGPFTFTVTDMNGHEATGRSLMQQSPTRGRALPFFTRKSEENQTTLLKMTSNLNGTEWDR